MATLAESVSPQSKTKAAARPRFYLWLSLAWVYWERMIRAATSGGTSLVCSTTRYVSRAW